VSVDLKTLEEVVERAVKRALEERRSFKGVGRLHQGWLCLAG
jgi:hypothetical protein